ncbi:MAG: hypothetical protein A2W23_06180 [Planctomycetes bacterium RBG_16_43_13]|nr:MAG: hypothetical protein A2W23_06180 [Planctomycetes bacterium RBG_16_43_13]
MATLLTLVKREVGVYFISPMAYIIITVYMLFTGYFFYAGVYGAIANGLPASYQSATSAMLSLTIFMMPLITMRLLAEEKNRGTFETLMTAPITDFQIVFAKFLAAVSFYILLLIPSLLYLVTLSSYATLDNGEVVGGYLALILLAMTLFSLGLFISSMCSNQISAGIITLIISIFLLITDILANSIQDKESIWRKLLGYVNIERHMSALVKGVVYSYDIVYLLSLVVLFLFLTVRVVESRRWR